MATRCAEDGHRQPKQALQYKPKGRRNIGRPRKRWRDQLEDQGTGNTPNPSGTWWWWWWWWWWQDESSGIADVRTDNVEQQFRLRVACGYLHWASNLLGLRSNNWCSVLTVDEIWKIRENIKPFSFNFLNKFAVFSPTSDRSNSYEYVIYRADGPATYRSKFTALNTKDDIFL